MDKLYKVSEGNAPPPPKKTKVILADDLNKVIDKVNDLIDDNVEIETSTSTSYQLVLTDKNKYKKLSNANAITVTIPLDSVVDFPIGSMITLEQSGVGVITVTITATGTLTGKVLSAGQYTILILIKTNINTWNCIGGTE